MRLPRRKGSASGRGRCRTAGAAADRTGAILSDAAGEDHRRLPSRRTDRHYGSTHWSVVVGAAWAAIRR